MAKNDSIRRGYSEEENWKYLPLIFDSFLHIAVEQAFYVMGVEGTDTYE
jgi:hypothetical protein